MDCLKFSPSWTGAGQVIEHLRPFVGPWLESASRQEVRHRESLLDLAHWRQSIPGSLNLHKHMLSHVLLHQLALFLLLMSVVLWSNGLPRVGSRKLVHWIPPFGFGLGLFQPKKGRHVLQGGPPRVSISRPFKTNSEGFASEKCGRPGPLSDYGAWSKEPAPPPNRISSCHEKRHWSCWDPTCLSQRQWLLRSTQADPAALNVLPFIEGCCIDPQCTCVHLTSAPLQLPRNAQEPSSRSSFGSLERKRCSVFVLSRFPFSFFFPLFFNLPFYFVPCFVSFIRFFAFLFLFALIL